MKTSNEVTQTSLEGKITLSDIKNYQEENNLGVYETISAVHNADYSYPISPKKPYLNSKHNSTDAIQYGKDMAVYENEMSKYNTKRKEYDENQSIRNSALEDFIKEESGLTSIPKQYQDKVYSKAYSDGHSSGYYSIYNCLLDLVEIFE